MEKGVNRILVADDHSVLRTGIIKSLSANFPEMEFGEAGNASEIQSLIHNAKWNLIILDISLPGRNGLEVLKDLKENHPEIPVIVFSMYPEDQFALRALKAGASAYLSKDIPANEFTLAVRTILKGERYLTPSLAELLTDGLRNDHNQPSHQLLSDREYQVFLLLASGMSVSGAAVELSLSVKTISVYRANILKKMNLKNNSEITHYAFKNNLVE